MKDLSGRRVLITGATSGIGRSAATILARRGAEVVITGRTPERAQAAVAEIVAASGESAVSAVLLELGDFASIRACAAEVLRDGRPLHVLVNNAGQAGGKGLTKDGFEITFGSNHLGPFLLTSLLLDRLLQSTPARIVNVASRAHEDALGIDFSAQRSGRRSRTGIPEYAVSKLANVMHGRALARRLAGTGVTTYALHPGVVASDIWRRVPALARGLMKLFMITNEEGAQTIVHCAASESAAAETGLYYVKEAPRRPSRIAEDDVLGERLWAQSATWVGADWAGGKG